MWKSLQEYITALGRWGWLVLMEVLVGGAGAYLDISGTWGFPTWVWLIMLGGAAIIVPFIAFHKVRIQRDAALSRLEQNGIARAIIVVSIRSYQFVTKKNGGLQVLFLPRIDAMPAVRVEDIKLELKGKRYDTDWQPMDEKRSGEIGCHTQADIPVLRPGSYQARVIACIDNREYPSQPFTVECPPSMPSKIVYLH